MSIPCQICQKRRARRHCPGLGGEICSQCCGAERENTIDCPGNCEHLREARIREIPPAIQEADLPNRDIRLTERFIREQEPLIYSLALALKKSMRAERAVDNDAHEALESVIRSLRTRQSGLIYESRSANPYAAAIQDELKAAIEKFRQGIAAEIGISVRDADVLGSLVFLQRLELQHNNGRRRGRAFLDFLGNYLPEPQEPALIAT